MGEAHKKRNVHGTSNKDLKIVDCFKRAAKQGTPNFHKHSLLNIKSTPMCRTLNRQTPKITNCPPSNTGNLCMSTTTLHPGPLAVNPKTYTIPNAFPTSRYQDLQAKPQSHRNDRFQDLHRFKFRSLGFWGSGFKV